MSFGHPGISALEFAGCHQEGQTKKTLALIGKPTPTPTLDEKLLPSANTEDTGPKAQALPSPPLQDINSQQRRRGTFINHTPRNFEMHLSRRLDQKSSSSEVATDPPTSSNGSTDGSATIYWSQPWQKSPPKSWVVESHDMVMNELIGDDSGEATPGVLDSRLCTPNQTCALISPTNKRLIGLPLCMLNDDDQQDGIPSSFHHQDPSKRRRRQTPYRISISKSFVNSRHAPLEPWVAQHRNQDSNTSFKEKPSQLKVDDASEGATFQVIQEYFDTHKCSRSSESTHVLGPCSPPNIALPNKPEQQRSQDSTDRLGELYEEKSNLFKPVPEQPDTVAGARRRSRSDSSRDSDFASAAQGQYSPYDKRYDDVLCSPGQNSSGWAQAARAGNSILGRMAPPILSHEALTATAELNDLSYYLKNTGPPLDQTKSQKKQSGLNLFKVGGKRNLAARAGSEEAFPGLPKSKPVTPACAREMTTSSGTKHLRIIIPLDSPVRDQTITSPVSESGRKKSPKNVPMTWTDEMQSPLASSAVEQPTSSSRTAEVPSYPPHFPLRSPKSLPIIHKMIPAADHPLATREEQTRARKLRDLKKRKDHVDKVLKEQDPAETTVSTTLRSPIMPRGHSAKGLGRREGGGKGQQEDDPCQMALLQQHVVLLQRQNSGLVEALADIVGFKAEPGDINAEAVLQAYMQVRSERNDSVGE